MYEKMIGFGWGVVGLLNLFWIGVLLWILFVECGVIEVTAKRCFVCFEGSKGELLKGKDGMYGMSIFLSKVFDLV